MASMSALRNAQNLARFVLVWFALSLGAAVASPLVKPQALQLVCSAVGGISLVASDGGDAGAPTLDCPLCAAFGLLPPFVASSLGLAAPQLHTPPLYSGCPVGLVSAAPPPGRGPPTSL